MPKITIAIPVHQMENWSFFLTRCLDSVFSQTFTDYEIVITKTGKMAENTNSVIERSRGEIIKILYMDDYLAHPNALKEIVDNFGDSEWLVTGCLHQSGDEPPHNPHYPEYNDNIEVLNTIGSPSVLAIRNTGHLLFDENLSFFLDCDLYKRYYKMYGSPKIINDLNVVIGLGDHQMTHLLSSEEKQKEFNYSFKKHQ